MKTNVKTRGRGFSVVEVLVVVTILALIAALLYPVYATSKRRAKERVCISNLKSIFSAISMYRSNHDGEGRYGDWISMGLPTGLSVLPDEGYMDPGGLECVGIPFAPNIEKPFYLPAGWLTGWEPLREPSNLSPGSWRDYVEKWRDEAIFVQDMNHQEPGTSVGSLLQTHRGLGLYVGGHVRVVLKKGDIFQREWWN